MPESIPIGKSDQALASSTAGSLVVSTGPTAIPVTPTSLTYTDGAAGSRVLAIVGGRHEIDVSAQAGSQLDVYTLLGDTVNPPFQIGLSSQYSGDPAKGWNFVVPIGHNCSGQANLYDPTKPSSTLVFEGDYYSDVFTPPEQSFETYISNVWPDGTVIRPWFANVGKTSKTAIVGLVCSRFTIAREDQAAMLNFAWDPISASLSFSTTYPGVNPGAMYSVAATATTDSFALGRSTNVGTNMFLNAGASGQIDKNWQLNGVTKFKQSLNSASGGTFTLYDPTGVGVEAAWVSAGKSYRQSTARTMIGYVIPAAATAQFEVVPVDPATIGLFVLGASGQTANYLQVQAWTGAKFLAVNGSGKVAIGDGAPIAKVLSATATLNFGSIAAGTTATLTMTVTGAVAGPGSSLDLGPPAALESGLAWCGKISATDTVSITLFNATASPIDPVSATWRATVRTF